MTQPKTERVLFVLNVFDRIVLRGMWIYRQNLFANVDTGKVTWRDVKFFRRR